MINKLKYTIASRLIKKKPGVKNFGGILDEAKNIFIIMPEDEKDFMNSIKIIEYLNFLRKDSVVFLNNSALHLIYNTMNLKIEEYFNSDKSKLQIPKQSLRIRLKKNKFDLLIDLNRQENFFLSICGMIVKPDFSIGFAKKGADLFYDFQFAESGNDSEISYKNLLNCLQMFK
jgi:hypothetical protein